MKNKFIFYFIFTIITYNSLGQSKIIGYTKDLLNNPIPNASILLTDSIKNHIVSYSFSTNTGLFNLVIPNTYSKYSLKISALGFKNFFLNVDSLIIINDTLQLQLLDETIYLKEVKVIAKSNSVIEKNDTTSFIVKKFTNGSEDVVEDALKQLPGIQISEDGSISYYGKKISKVLIEGDDMFKNNHRILTKNLGANTLDKVQIIDNYSENSLIKNINNSTESIMNLTILDSLKSKPNINITLGLGFSKIRDVGYNLLNISKKNKFFVAGNNNNIGKNNAQYSLENTRSESFETITPPINFDFVVPNLKLNRYNFNNSTFNSFNNSYSFNKKINLKTSFLQYNDFITTNNQTNTIFQLSGLSLEINELQSTKKKPTSLEGQIHLDYKVNTKTSLIYTLNYKYEYNNIQQTYITSNGDFNEIAASRSKKLYNVLNLTRKLGDKTAFTFNTSFFDAYIFQNYQLKSINSNQQISKHLSTKTEIDAHLLGINNRNNLKFDINGGINLNTDKLNISLDTLYIENVLLKNNNNGYLSSNRYFLQNSYTYLNSKVNITGELGINYRSFNFINRNKGLKYVTSKFSLNHKINSLNKISFFYSSNQNLPEISEIYPNYYITNYRSFMKGGSIQEFKNKLILINYIYSDFFNQKIFYANIIGIFNDKSFGKTYEINNTYSLLANTVVNGSNNMQINLNYSFFIPFISSTINIKSNVSRNYYENSINKNSRHNVSNSYIPDINLKYSHKKLINIEIGSSFNITKINVNKVLSNYNFSSTNYLYINAATKKTRANIKFERNIFDTGISTIKNCFVDVEIIYPIKRSKLELKLVGKNLTNNDLFSLYSINDFTKTKNQYNILPRQILLYCNFRLN